MRYVSADGAGSPGRLPDWAQKILRFTVHIMRNPVDQQGFAVAPRRSAVERTFAWATAHRRLARAYERRPAMSEATIHWAAINTITRHITRGRPALRLPTERLPGSGMASQAEGYSANRPRTSVRSTRTGQSPDCVILVYTTQDKLWLGYVIRTAARNKPRSKCGAVSAVTTEFGPYRLLDLMGRGGMGEVWRAYDTRTNRDVALKLLRVDVHGEDDYAARFRRESAQAARLNSPNIVNIHDYGEIDGRLFLDMALIEGTDLATLISRDPLPVGCQKSGRGR